MKKFIRKIIITAVVLTVIFAGFLIVFDNFIMPSYVYSPEITVPDLVGKNKYEAVEILKNLKLEPVEQPPRFDEKYEKDRVIYQNPHAGILVKEGRRVYIFISGGEPLIKMPNLVGKTFRDAKITVERLGLIWGTVDEKRSEFPAELIIEQDITEGENLGKGDTVNLVMSIGPNVGMIRVPDLLGLTLKEAESKLRRYSLKLGKINYLPSSTLLPNTIRDQHPTKDKLLNYGDSVDVFVAKSVQSNRTKDNP